MKCEDNNNSTFQINHLQNSSFISIFDTPEKGVSKIDRKLYRIKIGTSSINSSSTLFYFQHVQIYNRFHSAQNKHLMLNSCISGMNTSALPKKHYENIFSGIIVNKLHDWIENFPHVIHSPNIKYSFSVKINGTLVKKHKHLP